MSYLTNNGRQLNTSIKVTEYQKIMNIVRARLNFVPNLFQFDSGHEQSSYLQFCFTLGEDRLSACATSDQGNVLEFNPSQTL